MGSISIWGFFIRWDFLCEKTQNYELFAIQVAWASALSSILLGLWRFYVRYLDTQIIKLYPAMYLCGLEIIPDEIPIIKHPENVSPLTKDKISKGIDWKDICNKDFSGRGHHFIDWMVVFFIVCFCVISLGVAYKFQIIRIALWGTPHLVGWLLVGNFVGLLLVFIGWLQWRGKKIKWPIPKNGSQKKTQQTTEAHS